MNFGLSDVGALPDETAIRHDATLSGE